MRKQYYFRPSARGLLSWDVDRLVRLTKDFPHIQVPLAGIRELDEAICSDDEDAPTWRTLVEHVRLIEQADLIHPLILSADGHVMDGRHRLAKALLLGRATIRAVQFKDDPEPDYVGVRPDALPYDDAPNEGARPSGWDP